MSAVKPSKLSTPRLSVAQRAMPGFCCTHYLFLPFFGLRRNCEVCQIKSIVVCSAFTSSPRDGIFDPISDAIVFKAREKSVHFV